MDTRFSAAIHTLILIAGPEKPCCPRRSRPPWLAGGFSRC